MPRTLLRYLLIEQTVAFMVSLLVLTLVLFLGKTMRYTHLFFVGGSGLADFGKVLLYSLPYFFAFTIPMATLLAVLLAFARLAHDNELTAMKAAGIGFYQTIPPVALVAGLACLVTLGLANFILPSANCALKQVIFDLARSKGQLGLKERVFNDQFDGLVLFVNHISPDGKHMREVFISDERPLQPKSTIIAEEGFIVHDPEGKNITFRLLRGRILRVGDDLHSLQTIRFQDYDFNVDIESFVLGSKDIHKREQQLSFTELRKALTATKVGSKEHYRLSYEWHRRLSLPIACLVLGFIAAPLSIQSSPGSRLSGVVLGLFLFFFYYLFVSAAKALGKEGVYPPAIGLWLPNVIFGALAIILWVKTTRESPFKPISIARRFGGHVTAWIRDRSKLTVF